MGFLGDLFDSSKGAGYQAQGYKPGDLTNVTQTAQDKMRQQQEFYNAIAGTSPAEQLAMQQNNLTGQLVAQSQGQGPNPALAQLAQTTGQNVQNQAALMGSQRGVGQNPGLLARNIGQQGAAIQQQSAGQAALQRAQQQLAAQQQLQGQLGQQVGQQQTALNASNAAALQQQQLVAGQLSNQNTANAGIAAGNQKSQAGLVGGVLGGLGTVAGLAQGGVVPYMADGGAMGVNLSMPSAPQLSTPSVDLNGLENYNSPGPKSKIGQMFQTDPNNPMGGAGQLFGQLAGKGLGAAVSGLGSLFKGNPTTPSPDAQTNNLGVDMSMPAMGAAPKVMSKGGKVPGKPKVFGDDEANDTVPAMLSPGEIVIPNSVTMSGDVADKAGKFVKALLARGGRA